MKWETYEPVTPCMDVYKSKIQSDGSLDNLKLRTVVRGDLHDIRDGNQTHRKIDKREVRPKIRDCIKQKKS